MRMFVALGLTALLMTGSGCSSPSGPEPSGPAAGPSLTPGTPEPTVDITPPPDAPQTYEAAKDSADRLMLKRTDLPGDIWGPGGAVPRDDFPQVICGVPNEPRHPAGSFIARWVAEGGPELFQTVRPVGAAQAAQVVQQLGTAVRGCGTDERSSEDGRRSTWQVVPVQLTVPDAVAFRENQPGQGIYRFHAYVAQRDALVVFTTFSTSPDTPTNFFEHLINTLRTKA